VNGKSAGTLWCSPYITEIGKYVQPGKNILEIDVKERFGDDAAIYPLRFLSLKMIPTTGTPNGACFVTLPGIIEVFAEGTTDVDNITSSQTTTMKYIKNGSLYIQTGDKIFDVLGQQVTK
jgi:hypothetical protein